MLNTNVVLGHEVVDAGLCTRGLNASKTVSQQCPCLAGSLCSILSELGKIERCIVHRTQSYTVSLHLMLNYRLVRLSSTVIAALVLCIVSATAQVVPSFSKPRFIPKGPYQYDTTDAKGSITLAQETAGLLTREIDPRTYIVGPNDVLTVSVWATESVHDDVIVSPEGKIVLPEGGVIVVKGLSLDSVQTLVKAAVGEIFHQAKVDVSLRKLRQFKVYVLGAVAIPSVVTATAADHVFDVVERAGGVVDTASIRGVMLVREGQSEPIGVDLQRYMSYGDKSQNPTVLGGDRIIVPLRNTKNVIAIAGEVKQEGEFPFLDGDSLSTLVRMSGGILPSARLDSVVLVRMRPSDRRPYREFLDLTTWGDHGSQIKHGLLCSCGALVRTGSVLTFRDLLEWMLRWHDADIKMENHAGLSTNSQRHRHGLALGVDT
jgi:protein involved in polysaccharide export with SLBB domain